MLVPQNPPDDSPLWAALREALLVQRDFVVIADGAVVTDPGAPWTPGAVERTVVAFRAQPLRWVGARHRAPLAPHFAVVIADDGVTADVVELVVMRFRGDGDRPLDSEIVHALQVAAVAVSVMRPEIAFVRAPVVLKCPVPEGVIVDDVETRVSTAF